MGGDVIKGPGTGVMGGRGHKEGMQGTDSPEASRRNVTLPTLVF